MSGIKIKQFEPKKNNRYLVEFPKKFEFQEYVFKSIMKPNFVNGKWGYIRIEFYDPIECSTSKSLYNLIRFYQSNKDLSPLFDFSIKSLDPCGVVIEEWIISVKEIIEINFGQLDYSDDNMEEPFMIIKPLNCTLLY